MTIFLWDMSHYDAPSIGTALAQGISVITHKAGGDSSSGDPELGAWWAGVRGTDPAKLHLGTYWVPRPDLRPDPAGEADRWLATLDAHCPGWRDRIHVLQIDAERWPAGPKSQPSKAYLQTLGARLIAKMPRLRPVVYASRGQYGDTLGGLGMPLWNARYPLSAPGLFKSLYALAGGDKGAGWQPYSGQTPDIWQYSSSATIGGQTTSDASAFRGTFAEFAALVAPGWEDDMSNWGSEPIATGGGTHDGALTTLLARTNATTNQQIPALSAALGQIAAQLKTLTGKDLVDEPAIVAGVLAGLDPEAIAAAIPADLAKQVADILAARLQA